MLTLHFPFGSVKVVENKDLPQGSMVTVFKSGLKIYGMCHNSLYKLEEFLIILDCAHPTRIELPPPNLKLLEEELKGIVYLLRD